MSTALTGAAGEHYVAYQLSLRGYCVGLSRGGSPSVDIMISNTSGEGVAIQVKTSSGARRNAKRSPQNSRWEFDVSSKARVLGGERLFYAFVDLNWGTGAPSVFIVPSLEIKKRFAGTSYARYFFWIVDSEKDRWFNRWDYISGALRQPTLESPALGQEAQGCGMEKGTAALDD